ncbi:MAG: Neuraminidase domain-containing protein [Nitrospira sp.]|nr:MAG: Neuraminidase domain-containing protein [Nitrospira sp.]
MNPIIFPLAPGADRAAVADLQDALLECLNRGVLLANDPVSRDQAIALLRRERAAGKFADMTQKLLRQFQELNRLQGNGEVDEGTANALNRLLREWGLLDAKPPDTTVRIVAGVLKPAARGTKVEIAGLLVRAFHEGSAAAIRLGQDHTDSDGRFTIRYELLPGIPAVNLKVTVESRDGKALASSPVIPRAKPLETIELSLPDVAEPPAVLQQLAGIVRWPSRQPAPGITLRLYRLAFGGKESKLTEAVSASDGRFTLSYQPQAASAHLEIRQLKADSNEVVLTKPLGAVIAEQRRRLELIVPTDGVKVAGEYQRMSDAVVAEIGAIGKLADARENAERQDLTLLARSTGWDARLLALNCWAQRLASADEVGMSAEALYGLLRVGLPADKRLLAAVNLELVEPGLKKAREAGVIDLDDATITAQVKVFEAFAAKANLADAAPGSQSSYAELLATTGLNDAEQKTFAALFFAHSGDADSLWKKASAAGFTDTQVQALQLHGKLAFLTGNSAAMTSRLMKTGIKDPAELASKGLYTAEAWADELFDEAGIVQPDRTSPSEAALKKLASVIPSAYEGSDVLARARAFAADMARKVHRAYPTHVLTARLSSDRRFALPESHNETVKLLERSAARGYRLGQTPVSTFLEQQGLTDTELHATATRNLKALHATYSISPSDEVQITLMQMQLWSAHDVIGVLRAQFEKTFNSKYFEIFKVAPADGVARKVHARAEQVSSVVYSLFGAAQSVSGGMGTTMIPNPLPISDADRASLIRRVPTMESLFGSMDYCECQDCQSVLSPAAYLVDLLQYVDIDIQTWANTQALWKLTHGGNAYPHTFAGGPRAGEAMKPYDVLVQRRPDLPHLALTCENTHTALPYIDLVNEILEYHAAHGQLAAEAARNTDNANTVDLLAEPQNVIVAAYDALREATYPLALPFDRSLELARQFCAHADTPLHEVVQALRRQDDLWINGEAGRAEMFVESLGLSPAEAALFTRTAPLLNGTWHDLFGWPALRAAIQSPVNAPEASVSLADADISGLAPGMQCGYFDVSANVGAGEVNTLTAIGAAGSGGAGRTKLVFAKAWTAPPAAGDLLVLNAPAMLRSAKALSRRLGVSYREITQVVMTGFVNPGLSTLTVLYRARLNAGDAYRYKVDVTALDPPPAAPTPEQRKKLDDIAAFERRLTELAAESGSNLATLKAKVLAIDFSKVLVLADPDAGCNFDLTTLQHADGSSVTPIELVRINLFVRLWRRLGWSVEETDRALQVLVPRNAPFDGVDANLQKKPLASALVYLAHVKALDERLKLGANGRQKLLTLWSDIPTTGDKPLYVQLFLGRGAAKAPAAFENALGEYLTAGNVPLVDHMVTLQGAMGLTATDIEQVLSDAGMQLHAGAGGAPPQAKLTLPTVSLLYRHALLTKALKLSIADLLTLRKLSGLDPFKALHADPLTTLADDHPFSQTVAFVDLVELLRESGLKVGDVDALLRHRLNDTKLLRDDDGELLVLLKGLADGVQAIRAEHAVPADPGSIAEEVLLSKLGLVLAPEVASTFVSMLNGTVTYLVTETRASGETPLAVSSLAGAEGIIETRDDAVRNVQHLRFRGVLLDAHKTALVNRYPLPATGTAHVQSPLLARLLQQVQQQSRHFFNQHLRRSAAGVVPSSGFLDDADFDTLFAPVPSNDAKAADAQLKARRARLVQAFLPYLQQRLIRQFIVQTMAARNGDESTVIERLLTDKVVLNTASPLLDPLSALDSQGLTVRYFAADGRVLGSQTTKQADTATMPSAPSGTTGLLIEGSLEVPANGAWRFYVELDQANATAELRFPHRTDAVLIVGTKGAPGAKLDQFLDLKAGVPYRFELRLGVLGGGHARLLVQGESFPKDMLSQLTLRPADGLRAAAHAVALLDKLLLLMRTLGLDDVELRHFSTHAADFGTLNLSTWPTSRVNDGASETAAAVQRFAGFRRLLEFSRLKRDLRLTGNDLVAVFEANALGATDRLTREVYPRLARLTGCSEANVQAVAETLWAAPSFSADSAVRRLWDALRLVDRFGVAVATMASCTDLLKPGVAESRRAEIARGLQDAIKARAGEQNWPRVAQPIFDRLRQRQRDALVAYALHKLTYERLEQLYEHFLIDPGMEPVVQTSRVRLAIASVQLFVQRCFLNLEPQVHPSVLDAKRWQWLRHNPVWAGNRKLWLFPENVLEPEFRDDKTPLFEALEGALLQGDVSNDLVEDAFLAYVRQLDKIARLDLVAMHLEDHADASQRVLHVFGRTYGEPHEYFYRRCQNGSWTTWEPVPVTVQGDHLAPVVWRERLFLFWVTFLEKADPAPSMDPTTSGATIAEASLGSLMTGLGSLSANKVVELQLHWAQYQSGAWTTAESGGLAPVISKTQPATFHPREAFIHVSKEFSDDGVEGGVFVHLSGFDHAFYLAGRNAAPEPGTLGTPPQHVIVSASTVQATRQTGAAGALNVQYTKQKSTDATKAADVPTEPILQQVPANTVLACNNALAALGISLDEVKSASDPVAAKAALDSGLIELASLIQPFFYQDNRHTFFVQPEVRETLLEDVETWVTRTTVADGTGIRELNPYGKVKIVPQFQTKWPLPVPPIEEAPFAMPKTPGDPMPELDWLVNPKVLLTFDQNTVLGNTGQLGVKLMDRGGAGPNRPRLGGALQLDPASETGINQVELVVVSETELAQSQPMLDRTQVVMLGKSGLNIQLRDTLSRQPMRTGSGPSVAIPGRR